MNLHPNTLAVFAALCFGFMLIPWGKTLQNMGSPQLQIILGASFVVAGLIQQFLTGGRINATPRTLLLAVFGVIVYIFAIIFFNAAVTTPGAKLGVVAAITATYPIIAALSAAVFVRQVPTPREMAFMLLTTVGVVGLSLSGKGGH